MGELCDKPAYGGLQSILQKQKQNLYLDRIGHSPCIDVYVFAMLNVRLQNHTNCATMVTCCGAMCIGELNFCRYYICTYICLRIL